MEESKILLDSQRSGRQIKFEIDTVKQNLKGVTAGMTMMQPSKKLINENSTAAEADPSPYVNFGQQAHGNYDPDLDSQEQELQIEISEDAIDLSGNPFVREEPNEE